jgi:hypothetical protein
MPKSSACDEQKTLMDDDQYNDAVYFDCLLLMLVPVKALSRTSLSPKKHRSCRTSRGGIGQHG